jgi:hypothetical protein
VAAAACGSSAHLEERLRDRRITVDDLYKLKFWIEQPPGPDVPEGDWYKDFGTFKLAGRGPLLLTFLTADQIGFGTQIRADDED